MSSARWQIITEIFHAALERDPVERDAFLDSACRGDVELRREVETLLQEGSQIHVDLPFSAYRQTSENLEEPRSLTGTELNHYRIGPRVGVGAAAAVYRAYDTRLKRDVAVKILHAEHLFDGEQLARLRREAQILAAVNHPNIASVYGLEEANRIFALVLEFVEGETLTDHIARSITDDVALGIGPQIASALEAVHSRGIVHRDLKPSNIKITPDGTIKVLDFGIAKLMEASDQWATRGTELSRGNVVLGTVAYMSPEQSRGKNIDARTDIWAFGCVMYEVLTGHPAFLGDTPTDTIVKITTEEPDWRRLSRRPGVVSAELGRVIRKCLEKRPELRYQSVRELAVDLDRVRNTSLEQQQDTPHVLPDELARPLFQITQFGYLALYGAAGYYFNSITRILDSDFLLSEDIATMATVVLLACGVAVRIYLISAVGWAHRAAGENFHRLFPSLLVLDGIWAASPLLLWRHFGYGVPFIGVAMLAYVPFAERTLVRKLYPDTPVRGFSRLFEAK